MKEPLRILHLEDDPDYSELVRTLLDQEKLEAELVLVDNQADFEAALAAGKCDIILADYLLPGYTGIQALETARAKCSNTPFLLVSGTIGEQAAIDSLKAGATDYVLKQWPERLVPAVRRAMQEVQERKQRHRLETELIRRERYFRTLTENALDLLTILDQEGQCLYNSPSLRRVLGYEPRNLAGQNVFALIHADDVDCVKQGFKYGLEHPDEMMTLVFRFRHRNGSWRYLEAVGQNRLADPGIAGIVVNSRDITDRRRAEQEVRESELLFHSVWENSVDGMRLTDKDGQIVAVNEAFCKLVELPRDELEGKPFTVIFANPVPQEESLPAYQQRFQDRAIDRQAERRLTLHNGKVVTFEDTYSFVELSGRPPLLLGLFRDVTGQKQLEDQLRQSQKMDAIGQLAGGVAHDFNNILTVIHGHASLLLASGELSAPATRSAQQIGQAAERAAALTRQLLTFSRRQIMQPRQLDLNEVVCNMSGMLPRILGEDIALQLSYSAQPALVQADSGMLEQVLLNLAVNSRDAMPKGGQLAVRISMLEVDPTRSLKYSEARPGRFVCLSVADTGCGIAPQNLRRIFEPFFTTKEVGKGTGLGLATVYGIIKQHQGWIEVESQPSQGACFKVFLPAVSGPSRSTEEAPPQKAVRGGHETILVVEDEAPLRELVCDFLSSQGYRILKAESAIKALEVWRENQQVIDLLLTDLVMPERMNGRELAERLWADRPKLKVIFSSGYSAEVVGKDFVLRRGSNYLQKPYHPQKLALVVRDCLDALN